QGEKGVRGESDEAVEGEAPGDVLDMRVEAAVLVDHEDARKLSFRRRRMDEVSAGLAVALGRVILEMLPLDPFVIRPDRLRRREVRAQLIEQHHRCDSTDGELGSLVEEHATLDGAVN